MPDVSQESISAAERSGPSTRIAGTTIALCAGLGIVAIAFHPTVSTPEAAERMADVARLGLIDRVVHGALIVWLGGLIFGFSAFCMRRGFDRATILAGFVAFAIGCAASIGATLLDGFLAPAIGTRYAGTPQDSVRIANTVLEISALAIQILTKVGVVALSAGILFWCADLVSSPRSRQVGVIGIASAILPVALVASGVALTAHTVGIIVVVQAVWFIAVATMLIREQL